MFCFYFLSFYNSTFWKFFSLLRFLAITTPVKFFISASMFMISKSWVFSIYSFFAAFYSCLVVVKKISFNDFFILQRQFTPICFLLLTFVSIFQWFGNPCLLIVEDSTGQLTGRSKNVGGAHEKTFTMRWFWLGHFGKPHVSIFRFSL